MRQFFAILAFILLALPSTVQAQGIERQKLRFQSGQSQSVVIGRVSGRQTIDYIVNARRGQTMSVRFAPSSGAAFFNAIAPFAANQ